MSKRTPLVSTMALSVALAALTSACTAHKQPSKVETALANMAKDVVIPIEAEHLKNPLSASPEVLQQGREVYMQSCALCHGSDGHARTDIGRAIYPPAMDLTSPHVQNHAEPDRRSGWWAISRILPHIRRAPSCRLTRI